MGKLLGPALLSDGGFDRKAHSDAHGTECKDLSLTRQSEAEDADINVIVRRFGITGQMPQGLPGLMYGDFTGIEDYQSAFAAVADAQEQFMMMPADVRTRFGNDPQKFLEFCEDKNNGDEMLKLGLRMRGPEEPKPQKVEIVGANVVASPPSVVVNPIVQGASPTKV